MNQIVFLFFGGRIVASASTRVALIRQRSKCACRQLRSLRHCEIGTGNGVQKSRMFFRTDGAAVEHCTPMSPLHPLPLSEGAGEIDIVIIMQRQLEALAIVLQVAFYNSDQFQTDTAVFNSIHQIIKIDS